MGGRRPNHDDRRVVVPPSGLAVGAEHERVSLMSGDADRPHGKFLHGWHEHGGGGGNDDARRYGLVSIT